MQTCAVCTGPCCPRSQACALRRPVHPAARPSGLEVRVAFGSVWKESLSELSGGQRSLLALSLILALCRCALGRPGERRIPPGDLAVTRSWGRGMPGWRTPQLEEHGPRVDGATLLLPRPRFALALTGPFLPPPARPRSYKPAPIYILDEVDAALDLNHTQVGHCVCGTRTRACVCVLHARVVAAGSAVDGRGVRARRAGCALSGVTYGCPCGRPAEHRAHDPRELPREPVHCGVAQGGREVGAGLRIGLRRSWGSRRGHEGEGKACAARRGTD